jgi:hypothetical protein
VNVLELNLELDGMGTGAEGKGSVTVEAGRSAGKRKASRLIV